MKIPVPYQLILSKVNGHCPEELIEVKKFRRLIVRTLRCNRGFVNQMLNEMKQLGIIKYENHRLIRILKNVD